MLFNSYEFLFFFLPITLCVYLTALHYKQTRFLVAWLVLSSLFFYGWWNPKYLVLIIASMLFNYVFGRLVSSNKGHRQNVLLALGVGVNLALIAYFKYANFFVEQINLFSDQPFDIGTIILPLAISFFTFQQIAYLVDAKKNPSLQYSFLEYSLFVTFFPQLIAGPIVHHAEMMPQFSALKSQRFNYSHLAIGMSIFAIGLFKKTVLADGIAPYSNDIFQRAALGEELGLFVAWGGALAYTFQLYFDFSGYSDMAIGVARMFGIVLPLNFFSPYKSRNISEFWRRWHITLSTFLRDYLYIALGGNRRGTFMRYRNLLITMLLGGLWHGAGWNFVLWGFLHGAYLIVHQLWEKLLSVVGIGHSKLRSLVGWVITINAVVFAWVFFRATSFDAAINMLKGMIGMHGASIPNAIYQRMEPLEPLFSALSIGSFLGGGTQFIFTWLWIVVCAGIVLLLPNLQELFQNYHYSLDTKRVKLDEQNTISGYRILTKWRPTVLWAAVCALFLILGVMTLSQVSEFLYFQF